MRRAALLWLAAGLLACTDSGVIGYAPGAPDAAAPETQEPETPVKDAGDEPEAEPEPPACTQTDAGCQRCIEDDDCPGGECDDGVCRPEEEEHEDEEASGSGSEPEP